MSLSHPFFPQPPFPSKNPGFPIFPIPHSHAFQLFPSPMLFIPRYPSPHVWPFFFFSCTPPSSFVFCRILPFWPLHSYTILTSLRIRQFHLFLSLGNFHLCLSLFTVRETVFFLTSSWSFILLRFAPPHSRRTALLWVA